MAPVPLQRANLDSEGNRCGSPTSASRVAAAIGPMPDSSRRLVPCWSSRVSSSRSSPTDLAASGPVLVHQGDQPGQPGQPVLAGQGGSGGAIDVLEPAEPGFDLAGGGELVADLCGEFGELVLGVVQGENAQVNQHSAVFEHRLDLGDERVVDLQGLYRAKAGFCQECAGRCNGIDDVGLVQPSRPPLGSRALRGDLPTVEPRRYQCDGGLGAPPC